MIKNINVGDVVKLTNGNIGVVEKKTDKELFFNTFYDKHGFRHDKLHVEKLEDRNIKYIVDNRRVLYMYCDMQSKSSIYKFIILFEQLTDIKLMHKLHNIRFLRKYIKNLNGIR